MLHGLGHKWECAEMLFTNALIFLDVFSHLLDSPVYQFGAQQQSHSLPLPSLALTHPLHPESVIPEEFEQLKTGYTFMSQQHPEPR